MQAAGTVNGEGMIVRGSRCWGQGNLPSLGVVMPATARLSPLPKVTFCLASAVRQSPDGHKDVQGLPRSEVNRLVSSLNYVGVGVGVGGVGTGGVGVGVGVGAGIGSGAGGAKPTVSLVGAVGNCPELAFEMTPAGGVR
jgi:hypothetical protein